MGNKTVDRIPAKPSGGGKPGPYLAKIVSHIDPTYMGTLEVEILRPVGNAGDGTQGQLHQVKMVSPFWGSTGIDYVTKDPNDYNNTQKSYGMWFVPPDVGSTVLIFFIDGDSKRGYWFGCVPDEAVNFMVPGIAATEFTVDGKGRVPVAEYNKRASTGGSDATQVKKPKHPFATVLEKQGLLKDDIRGITTSSARREVPSHVFGISTPGPIDKKSGAKKGAVGKKEHRVEQAFVSRLGGSTFVMDDGDDKFLRKKSAGEAKPEYVSVEQNENGGNVAIPHNELVRIRTRTGHQILLHNSEDLIYIGNSSGTTWIELTSNGKIDIYAKDSISIHTENDLNVTAERDINLTAKRDFNVHAERFVKMTSKDMFNIYSFKDFKATAAQNYQIKAGTDGKLTVGGTTHIKSGGNHIETASQIHMNGPGAAAAVEAEKAPSPVRIPRFEPWGEHENLDPTLVVPAKTEAKIGGPGEPKAYTPAYTTKTDTFKKIKPPEKKK